MKRKINDTLLQLMIGILISGLLVQVAEIIIAAAYPEIAGSRFSFALGLWIGVVTALASSIHMYHSIDKALDMQPDTAENYMRRAYLIRTVLILAVTALVHFLKLGYVMAAFVGMMCLKFGAFLNPFIQIIMNKFRKSNTP